MKVRVFKNIENEVYTIRIETSEFTERERMLIQQYGEPEIEVGGVYLDSTTNEYQLPSKIVRIRSDFPYTQRFDSRDVPFDTNTLTKVGAWKTDVLSRLDDAITTLLANVDSFSGEEVYTYPN